MHAEINGYKYLIAMIESLCFSSGPERRKFLQIIEGLEWQQQGVQPHYIKPSMVYLVFDF
jgi:hypothetical protein